MIDWSCIPKTSRGLHYPRRSLPLHALISSGGHTCLTTHDYDFKGLDRGDEEFVVFQYTLKGRGLLEYEGENYTLTKGSAMLVHIPHDHHYCFPPESHLWEFVYLCFYGSEVLRLCRSAEASLGPLIFPEDESPLLAVTGEILSRILGETGEPDVLQFSSLAYDWAMKLAGMIDHGERGVEPDPVRRVRQFCRDHLAEPIGVDDMARAARCSRSHLTRIFSRHTQMGLQEYLEYLRMQKAARLLYSRDLTVKEVSSRCGYADENYFCKVFKKNFNNSPGRYREIGL